MARAKRTRIATGIFSDKFGISVITKVRGEQLEERWPLNTNIDKLVARRAAWKYARISKADQAAQGTFATAVAEYLKTLPPKTRRYQNADTDLGAWLPAFQRLEPSQITPALIRQQLALWADLAPSTLNHRRQELKNLFTLLNGKSGANPIHEVPRVRGREAEPRGMPPEVIDLILAQMEPSHTKLRLAVLWYTALPPAQIGRLERSHFHPTRRTLFVRPRRKGAGVPAKTLPLLAHAVTALQAFFDAKAEGSFSTSSVYKSFKLAASKAKIAWAKTHQEPWPAPENLHPYDLRHSRLTEAYRKSRDLNAVAELGLHADLSTTQRYVKAVATETAAKAIALMEEE